VNEVVSADPVGVAVAVDHDHPQVRVSEMSAGGNGQRPAVDRHEAVGVQVIRQLAPATDTAYDQRLVRLDALRDERSF